MQNRNFIAEESSFWDLLQKTKIEIPIVQRDYAQGRVGEEKVRQLFLKALFDAIVKSEAIELDFIYGSKESGALQPLDGQQRLTTLYLLHWYAAAKENISISFQQVFENFTYETRASSRRFCEQLARIGFDFNALLPSDEAKGNRISKTITDSPWFFLAWRKDPTIKAMLNMLDDIDMLFKDVPELWHKLSATRLISFHYIELKNFGLSDDLYIKMNARGKPLTPFENFKARMERHISAPGWDTSATEHFLHAVDTTWTDLFWSKINDPQQIDIAFAKYLSGVAIGLYAQRQQINISDAERTRMREELQKGSNSKVTDEAVNRALIEKRIEELFNQPEDIQPTDFLRQEDLTYLSLSLHKYAALYHDGGLIDLWGLPLWDLAPAGDLFHEFTRPKGLTTYRQRVLFYAQTAYLLTNAPLDTRFLNWLRVIRNIVQNATIDRAAAYIGAIGLVRELSEGCLDIYGYLAANDVQSNFADRQVEEERRKAINIEQYKLAEDVFHAMEDTNFCRGRIMFGLYCLGISREDLMAELHLDKIDETTNVFNTYLAGDDITNVFRRALLSMGDNRCYNYWWSWSYSTNTTKRCLIEDLADLIDYAYNEGNRHYLSMLVRELWNKTPEQIIDEFTPHQGLNGWVTRLIKESELLDKYGQSKYFGLKNDEKECYLYNNWKRPGSLSDCFEVQY